jgi:membrane protein
MSEGAVRDEAERAEREAVELERGAEQGVDRLRQLVEGIANRVGGHPAVVRVQTVMDTYDRAGGGLVAGGLAYTSLLAILPGLLLGLSAVGFLVRDPALQVQIVNVIGEVLPPFEEIARTAFEQVSRGAVPTGIIAIIGLFWGSSRFYANLDTAFSRIFRGAPRRNPVVQTVRGVVLTVVLMLVPIGLVTLGSFVTWLTSLAPDGVNLSALLEALLELASPLGSLIAFSVAVGLCYRFVPSEHVSWRSVVVPAVAIGVVLAVLTQIYVFIAPRLVGAAAIYGTFVALFALLAWLSIAFNVLLIGAAWTEVRRRYGPFVEVEVRIREDGVEGRGGGAEPGV